MVLGVASPGFAANLGVLTTLDVCDSLGISGLTLSSSDNCLKISGEVEYTFIWGDYDADHTIIDDLEYAGDVDVFIGDDAVDWESTTEFSLTFDASSASDFGTARGVITLEGTHETVVEDLLVDDETNEVVIDEAYVAIGDSTVIMAGMKGSIAATGDDTSFTYQEMFNEDEASGVGYNSDATNTDIDTGGHVIQIESDLGNGVTLRGGLEDLDDLGTLVGSVIYESDTIDGHVTVLADEVLTGVVNDWAIHAGMTADLDNFRVRAALATNNDGWWNGLLTADAEFDIFTIAVGAEMTSEQEFGVAGSVSTEVSDGVVLNLGSRAFRESDGELTIDTLVEGEVELGETVTVIAGAGYIHESEDPVGLAYGRVTLEWSPGGDFETELTGRIHSRSGSDLGYELTFAATRSFQ
jgi:hypothetical protein